MLGSVGTLTGRCISGGGSGDPFGEDAGLALGDGEGEGDGEGAAAEDDEAEAEGAATLTAGTARALMLRWANRRGEICGRCRVSCGGEAREGGRQSLVSIRSTRATSSETHCVDAAASACDRSAQRPLSLVWCCCAHRWDHRGCSSACCNTVYSESEQPPPALPRSSPRLCILSSPEFRLPDPDRRGAPGTGRAARNPSTRHPSPGDHRPRCAPLFPNAARPRRPTPPARGAEAVEQPKAIRK